MEIMNIKIKGDGFKVTPQSSPEALKTDKEADILSHQGIDLFTSKPIKWVLEAAERSYNKEHSELLNRLNAFNYGYILGKRAERARRRKEKQL